LLNLTVEKCLKILNKKNPFKSLNCSCSTLAIPLRVRNIRMHIVISERSDYLVEETGGTRENHRPVVCQRIATGRWFSPGPLVSSTNKTDRYDITERLLKVALSTIKQTNVCTVFSRDGISRDLPSIFT
jgi:hypothetical protein